MTEAPAPPSSKLHRSIAVLLASGFGAGFSRWAPGTVGTAFPGLPLAWGLAALDQWATLTVAAALFLCGWWAAGVCERVYARKDPQIVVIDEVVGLLLASAWLPPKWPYQLGAFVAFRLFDILKPWPARTIDRRCPGGLGVMLDDVVAGIYARLAVAGVVWLLAR